ncbi:hypothetical protein EYZ11_012576 [Aspergillus tanneri]|uniref:Uncharacterized protein n=1 Tax=Aspergillus tanneri TaxID=1220188 RepID=A0A4S3IZW9_9EURO|nr:hypothetical protein EYZ11_012576 [Aspergillus tanneri]
MTEFGRDRTADGPLDQMY